MRRVFLLALLPFLVFQLFFSARPALAVSDPQFPDCPNPGGSVLAQYSDGSHGIPGDSASHSGSDAVYSLNDTQVVQCFCAPDGTGIQTNWWKQSSLDSDQFNQLVSSGWILVPDGSAWGLASAPYLVRNQTINCGGTVGASSAGFSQPGPGSAPSCNSSKPGTPTNLVINRQGDKAVLTWSPADSATTYTIAYGTAPGNYIYGVPDTGNVTTFTVGSLDPNSQYYFVVRAVNNCMPGDWNATTGGQVLGLANTGDSVVLYSVLGLAVLLLVMSLWAKRMHRDN